MNVLDILKYGNQTVQKTLDGLPDEAWQTGGACGVWSVKDIIAHLACYETVLADLLLTFATDAPPPASLMKLRQNDEQVALRRDNTVQQVLDEYNQAHAHVMELAAQIDASKFRQIGTIPWYSMEYALDDFLVYSYYGHKREHCAQIAAFRDTL